MHDVAHLVIRSAYVTMQSAALLCDRSGRGPSPSLACELVCALGTRRKASVAPAVEVANAAQRRRRPFRLEIYLSKTANNQLTRARGPHHGGQSKRRHGAAVSSLPLRQPEVDIPDQASSYSSRVVALWVGENFDHDIRTPASKVTIHEAILRKHSAFFRDELDRHWLENGSGVVQMPDDEPEDVVTYINWLYTKAIPAYTDEEGDYLRLARLYVFGERVEDDGFCDAVLSEITKGIDVSRSYPAGHCIEVIYSGTPPGSPARGLLVEVHAAKGRKDWFGGDKGPYPVAFLEDLVKHFIDYREPLGHLSWHNDRARWFKQ